MNALFRGSAPVLLLAIGAGMLLPTQFATNSALARTIDSSTLTGAISYATGAALLGVLIVAQRLKPDWAAGRRAPRWVWFGGLLGSAYVVGSVVLTRALGAALATTFVIASQIVAAIAFDHFGWFGLQQRRVNPMRFGALALALSALAIKYWGTL
jgi:bacterial/archaeal transporter family-2 protein